MAQPLVVQQKTATYLVQNVLLGNGITISNITSKGLPASMGFFKGNTTNIGLDSGIIMTTGTIQGAVGPNTSPEASTDNYLLGDADLNTLSVQNTFDASVIEFDFVPTSDTVRFKYVFASEEYMEWVGGSYNDVFGFFLTGVSVNLPKKNIALIPGTNTAASINNVNLNNYPNYYVDNGDGWGTGTATDGLTIKYDGFTKVFTAVAAVQCGEKYHIKLAVADGFDGSYDSGVFIEAGSFTANSPIQASSAIGQGNVNSSTVYENNGIIDICLSRGTQNLNKKEVININISGTAENGVDYVYIPDSIVFAIGIDSVCFPIQIISDNQFECKEEIDIELIQNNPCIDSEPIQFKYYIQDTCISYFHIPNAFTPDGNGINDVFIPAAEGIFNFKMNIFDRWGRLIFSTTNHFTGWDGKIKGEEAPLGVYICQYSVESIYGDFKEENKLMHVVLLR